MLREKKGFRFEKLIVCLDTPMPEERSVGQTKVDLKQSCLVLVGVILVTRVSK